MMSWTSTRTETRRADTVKAGDRIIDPAGGRSILTVYRVEPLGGMLYIDAVKRRSVMRRVSPSMMVEVCIPKEHER